MSTSTNFKEIEHSSPRSFGVVFSIFFLIISLYPLTNSKGIHIWALILSVLFLFLAFVAPKSLSLLNKLWFKFGIFLGKIVSPLIMGIIFFLVVTPIGLIMRLLGKDVLNLKYNKNQSYWIEKNGPKSKMKNQF